MVKVTSNPSGRLRTLWVRVQMHNYALEVKVHGFDVLSSAGIWILYMYVTSSCIIRYNNRGYAVVVQRKICARWQISAPSCVHANDLSNCDGDVTMLEHVFINLNLCCIQCLQVSFLYREGGFKRYSHTNLPVCTKIMKMVYFTGSQLHI